jgi:hypothetical protein
MEILVFKTNIHRPTDIERVGNIFRNNNDILKWTVDTEDVDKVLRIEATDNITAGNLVAVLGNAGYNCSMLE